MKTHRVGLIDFLQSMSALQQAFFGIGLLLTTQYILNVLSYFNAFPLVFGVNPNGVIKNTAYVIPGFLAVALSLFFEGGRGAFRIFRPYSIWKVNIAYWLLVIWIMFPLVFIGLVLSDIVLMRDIVFHQPTLLGWDHYIDNTPLLAQVAISDELFWIGFVLPRLVKGGFSPFKASLVMSFFWGLDYVPYLFTDFYLAPGVSAYLLMFGSFATTPWYVWLYYRTGSALILLVFNVFIQYSQNIMPMLPQVTGSSYEPFFALLTILLFGLLLWRVFPVAKKPANEQLGYA